MKILQSTNQELLESFVNSLNVMAGFPNDGTKKIARVSKHTTQDLWFLNLDCLDKHIGDLNRSKLPIEITSFKSGNQVTVAEIDKTVAELYSELYTEVLD